MTMAAKMTSMDYFVLKDAWRAIMDDGMDMKTVYMEIPLRFSLNIFITSNDYTFCLYTMKQIWPYIRDYKDYVALLTTKDKSKNYGWAKIEIDIHSLYIYPMGRVLIISSYFIPTLRFFREIDPNAKVFWVKLQGTKKERN